MTPEPLLASHFTVANRTAVSWLVVHTMEVPCVAGMALRVAQRFALGERPVSAHYCVDPINVIQCVRDADVAWHCPGANRLGIGIEHAGYSEGPSATDWLTDSHAQGMLPLAAQIAAQICHKWSIPIVRLTPAQIQAGEHGIIGHADATIAFATPGGHTDPGPTWPWDQYLRAVAAVDLS